MLFCKCLENMLRQNDNDQKLQPGKKNKLKQNVETDKKSEENVEKHEDNKVVGNLSTISFILKDLADGNSTLSNLQDSQVDSCPACQMTKEEYKIEIKYVSLLEKIINSVIQKEVTKLLEGIHEVVTPSSSSQQTNKSIVNKNEDKQKSIVLNPEQHSLRCLLIRLQRVLGKLILQICFSLSSKNKSEKLNRLSKLNMTDITLLELRTLNYQFSALTDHIIYMFKDSKNVSELRNTKQMENSNKQIVSLKQKINDSINAINSTLNSVKKIQIQQHQNKSLSRMTDGKCCNRIYPHVHCSMNGNNFVMKYVKSKENKNITVQPDSDEKSKYNSSVSPTKDSTAVKPRTLWMPTDSTSSLSMNILHDKLLTIIKDSAELQKKINEISKNKINVNGNEEGGTDGVIEKSDIKDKSSFLNIKTSSDAKSVSRKELENAIDDIILDACNKYSSHTECKYTPRDLNKSLSNVVDDTKAKSLQKQTDYLINHAHLLPSLINNLSRDNNNNNNNNKYEMNVSTTERSKQKGVQLCSTEPDVSTSTEYLPYAVSIESLPLSPEEIEELSLKTGKDKITAAGKYEHENFPSTNRNNIFGMDIRCLSDLINDDKCERNPHITTNPNAAPYSPSLTSLPLTNAELEELVVKLNKSKCNNKEQSNNTEMQVMYFKTDIKPNFVVKNRRSLSCSENMKTKQNPDTVTNTVVKVSNKKPSNSDKINLQLTNNLSCTIRPPMKANRTYQTRRNKNIEQYKDNCSKSSDFGDTGKFKNALEKELFTIKENTDLEIMNSINAKIKCSNHNLYRLGIHRKRLNHHKGISSVTVDSECKRLKNMSKDDSNVKRFLSRDMRTRPVENNVNRLSTKSININKSKHKIKSNENILKKRQQRAKMNTDVINNKCMVKRQDDKNRVKRTIHYSSITFQFPSIKVISLNKQNCIIMDKREICIVVYKLLLNTGCKYESYLKLNHILRSKAVYPKSIKQHNFKIIIIFPIEFYVPQIIVIKHIKNIHMVKYAEYKNNLYFNIEKDETLLAELKVKAKHPVLSHIKKRSFIKSSNIFKKRHVRMKNWCGDTRNLGQYSFSELDITDVDTKLSHYMYLTIDDCLNCLNNNTKYKKKHKKDVMFKNINTQESAQEFLKDIAIFLKSNKPTIVPKKQVLSQVFDTCNTTSNEENTQMYGEQLQKYNAPNASTRPTSFHKIHNESLYLFDILGRPLTDNNGHVLKSRKGGPLLKYNNLGTPISDMFGGPVFDANGLRPSEYEFNATRTPYKVKSPPLVNTKHEPLKIYDCNGRPLTSDDGIPLANSSGEIMLKFDSQGHPVSDILGKPIYISNHS